MVPPEQGLDMKPILDPAYRPILQKFLKPETLMAFDYDGTLAPIVDDPSCAEMRPKTRELLRLVATRYPVVVITGRGRADTLRFLDGIPLLEIIGNHGAENRGSKPSHIVRRVADWHRELEKRLQTMAGIVLEDKRYSLTIHYRQSTDMDVESMIRSAAENLQHARLIGGKCILNIVPSEAPGKGEALLLLCKRLGTSGSIFVGDDDTDEDVFMMDDGSGAMLGIRVGTADMTAAHYYINDQADIDPLLEAMANP